MFLHSLNLLSLNQGQDYSPCAFDLRKISSLISASLFDQFFTFPSKCISQKVDTVTLMRRAATLETFIVIVRLKIVGYL